MLCGISFSFSPFGDVDIPQNVQEHGEQYGRDRGKAHEADADQDAERRRHPDERRRGDVVRMVRSENEAGSQKSDADNDVRGHAEKSTARNDGIQVFGRCGNDIRERKRRQGKERRSARNQHLGTHARFFSNKLPLNAQNRAQRERDNQPDQHLFKGKHDRIIS